MSGISSVVYDLADKYLPGYKESSSGNIVARCPFPWHNDRNPSFTISLDEGVFNCYGCHTAGSVSYFMHLMKVPRKHIDKVMKDAKPIFRSNDRATNKRIREAKKHKEFAEAPVLPEYVLGPYDKCPTYLLDLGFDMEVLRRFDVGYDLMAYRIIYPVRDHLGKLRMLYGRSILPQITPKVVVYNNIYSEIGMDIASVIPGGFLYNLHRIYPRIYFGDLDEIIVVEGHKDCIWLWQQGFHNVVAALTSRITKLQMDILRRFDTTIVLALDNDESGMDGTLKTLRTFMGQSGLRVKIAIYPDDRKDAAPDYLENEDIRPGMSHIELTRMFRHTLNPYELITQKPNNTLKTKTQKGT